MNFKNVTRVLLAALAVPAFAANGTMKGDGSAEKPFEIEDYEDLKAIGSGSYLFSSNYVVSKDIDASASKSERCDGDDDCRGFIPIGKNKDAVDSTVFWGTIDGKNHTIKNLKINNGYSGESGFIQTLIGSVVNLNFDSLDVKGESRNAGGVASALVGTIQNVHVTHGKVFGYERVGGIVGKAIDKTGYAPVKGYDDMTPVLRNVSFQGEVGGFQQVGGVAGIIGVEVDSIVADVDISIIYKDAKEIGGIAGYNYGDIQRSHSSGKVVVIAPHVSDVGGLVGKSYNGSIDHCYSSMDVEGDSYVGGLVGHNESVIFASSATGSVKEFEDGAYGLKAADYAGGLAGSNYGKIYASYALGSVIGDDEVGGLAGFNYGKIYASYALGSVIGDDEVGGLAGFNYGKIYASYALGSVIGDDEVGGLVGYNAGEIYYSYARGDVTSKSVIDESVGGLVGLSNGDIFSSYAANTVEGIQVGGLVDLNKSEVVNSYWDAELSKIDSSAGGMGLKTKEMMTMSSFAGWDTLGYWTFERCEAPKCEIDDEGYGCFCKKDFHRFWAIDEGKSYPYLNDGLDMNDFYWHQRLWLVYLRSLEQPPVHIQNQTFAKTSSLGAVFQGQFVALRFEIPTAGSVKFSLVDMQGRVVRAFDLGRRATGAHFETLDAGEIARGRYVGMLHVDGKATEKVMLLKK